MNLASNCLLDALLDLSTNVQDIRLQCDGEPFFYFLFDYDKPHTSIIEYDIILLIRYASDKPKQYCKVSRLDGNKNVGAPFFFEIRQTTVSNTASVYAHLIDTQN